jgi:outer membrane protein TolC
MASTATAQPVRTLTPDECVEIGLENNRAVHAARYSAVEAEAGYREARTHRLPVLSGQGSYQRLSGNIPDFEVDFSGFPGVDEGAFEVPAIRNRYDLRLHAEQPLFTGFRLHNRIRAADYQAEAAQQNVAATEADFAYEIREAYWALVEAQAMQEAMDTALEQVAAHLQDVRNLRAQGMALQSDVLAVQTRQAEVRLQQVEAESALRLARLTLNYRMGVPLDTEVRPSGDVQVEPLTESAEVLIERAWQRRPELSALTYEVQALEAGVAVARAGWLPQVNLVGTYNYARPNPYIFPQEDAFTGTWEAGFLVSMDLWNWGRTRAQTHQARAREDQARAQLDNLREAVRLEVMRHVINLDRAIATVAVTRQGVQEAEESYRVMRERVRQGMALTAEVLGAEVAYRNAQVRHTAALTDYAVARVALRRATGEPAQP